MLTYRTNILLDKERQRILAEKAKRDNTSIGELIRRAIDIVYKSKDDETIKKRMKAIEKLYEFQKKIKPTRGINYRKLIEYGRYL